MEGTKNDIDACRSMLSPPQVERHFHITKLQQRQFYGSDHMECKESTLSSEKVKRQLKTPAQVEALEKFYDEHKYPSESMKLQFAKKIGLSEKQVSGWFCHRRLKDKKLMHGEVYANGKQNLSNGLVHDRTSALRQESCSSTKQGDRHFDTKEVESKWSYGHNPSVAISALEEQGRHMNVSCNGSAIDKSPGSSSALQERLIEQDRDLYGWENLMYPFPDDSCMLTNSRAVKSRGPIMQSQYSYLQDESENPAISSVKWKLGRYYREDGPPLCVDFDPLPPGAFDSPIRDSNFEPYYVGESIQQCSGTIPKLCKEPKVYDKYKGDMLSSGSNAERIGVRKRMQRFLHQGDRPIYPSKPKTSVHNHGGYAPNQIPQTSLIEKVRDFAGRTPDCTRSQRGNNYKSKREDDGVEHRPHLEGRKSDISRAFPYPHTHHNKSSVDSRQEEFTAAKFSKSALKSSDFLDTEETKLLKRPEKKGKFYREKRNNSYPIQVLPKIPVTNETKMFRKLISTKFQQQDFLMESSEKYSWMRPRYARDMNASLSGEETGGATSSVDSEE